jgi:hypothetical protein
MRDLLLLSKDTVIAEIKGEKMEPIDASRLPLFLRRTGDIQTWLASRAIDSHRTHSRLLKRALRLESKDDISTVLSVNAATITDNYWVKPAEDVGLRYDDVRFRTNLFDRLALTGDVNAFDQPPSRTPELTNIGSFEKCWRRRDGLWWMIKAGKPEELFSELLAYRIGALLSFPMAFYEAAGAYIQSRDFTDDARVDFEPAVGIIGDESDYVKIYDALKAIDGNIAAQYVRMCYFDGLIFNMDRHEYNFGVLRDSDTGEILSLSPFFDHNIALVSRGYPSNRTAQNDRLIGDFAELVRKRDLSFCAAELSEAQIDAAVQDIPFELPATETVRDPNRFVVEYLCNRQARLKEIHAI